MLFELYSKYAPEELHRKLDGLVSRVLKQSASVGKSGLLLPIIVPWPVCPSSCYRIEADS